MDFLRPLAALRKPHLKPRELGAQQAKHPKPVAAFLKANFTSNHTPVAVGVTDMTEQASPVLTAALSSRRDQAVTTSTNATRAPEATPFLLQKRIFNGSWDGAL